MPLQKPLKPSPPPAPRKSSLTSRGAVSASPGAPTASTARSQLSKPSTSTSGKQSTPSSPISRGPSSPRTGLKRDDSLGVGFTDALLTRQERQQLASQQQHQSSSSQAFSAASSPRGGAAAGGGVAPAPKRGGFRRGGGKHGSGKHSSHHDDVLQRLAELHQQPWFRLRVAIRCILFALRAGRGVTRYRRHLYETTVLYPKAAFVIQCAWRRRCAHRRIVCRLAAARIRDFVKPKIQLRLQHKYQLIHLVQPIARGYLGRKQLQAAHHANRHLFATTAILKRIQIKVAAKLLRNIRMRREEVDILLEETAMASHAVIRQEFAAFTALQQQFTSQYRSLLVRARDAFLASHAADPHVASINLPNVHSTPAPSTLLPPLPSSSAHPSGVPPPAEQQPLPPLHVPTTFGFRKELDRLQASGKFMVDVPVTTTAPHQSHAHHHHPHHHQNRSLPPTAPPSSSHHHHPAFPHTNSGGYGYFQNAQLTHSSSVRTDPALPTPTGSTAALRGGGPSHHDSIAGATVTRPLVPFLQRGSLAMAITLTTQIEEFDHPAAATGDDVNNSILGGGTESPLGTVISLDSRRSSDQPPRDLGATATTKSTPPLDGPPMPMSAPSSPPPPASLPATNSNSAMETLQRDSNSSSALTQHSNTTTTMHSLVRTLFATKSLLAAARYNLSEAARLRLNSTLAPNNTSASSFGFQDEDKSTSDLQEGKKGATTTTTTSVPQAKRTNSNLLDDHNHHGDAAGRVATSTDLLGQSGAAIMVSIDFDDEAAAQSVLANYNNKDVTSSSSPLPTSLVPAGGGAATRTSSQSPPMVLSRSTSSGSSKHHPSPQRVESPAAVALIPSQGHVSPLLAAITMGSGQPSVMIPNPIVRHSSASQEQMMPPMLPPAAVISMSVAASPLLAPQGAASPPESLSPTGSNVSRPHSFHRNTSWSTTGAPGREGGGGGAGGGHASPAASPSAYGHHVTSGGNLLSPYGSAQSPAGLLGVRRHSRRKSSRALLPPDDVQLAFMALLQRTESIERKALQNEIREAIRSMHQHAKWFMVVVQHRDAVPRAFSSLLPQLSPLWLLELAVRLFYDEAHERAAITAEYEAMPLMYLTRPMLGTSTEERRQKMKEQLRQRGAKLNAQAYSQQQLQLTMMLQQQQQGGGGATGTGVQQSSPPALRNLGIPGAGDSLSVSPAQGYLPTTPQLLGFDSRGATPSFLFVPSESGGGHGGTGGGGSHLVSDDYSENETSSIALASTSRPFVSPAPSIGLPPSASALLPRSGAVVSPAPPPLHAGASLDANTTNASGGGVVDSLFFPMLGSSNVRAGAAAVLSASRPGGATNTTNNARRRLSSFEANALFPSRAQGSTGPTGLSVTNTAPPPLLPPSSSTGVPRVAPQTRTATEMLRLDMLHASQNRVRTMLMMKEFEHRGGAAGGAVEAKVPPKPKAVSIAAAFIRGLSVPKTESGGGGADYQSVGRPQW